MMKSEPSRHWIRALAERLGAHAGGYGAPQMLSSIIIDASLVGASLAAAAGSVVFAGYMLAQGDHKPNVNGLEYLAIFAQPKGVAKPNPAATQPAEPAPTPATSQIDTTPVGSINMGASSQAGGYWLVGARPDLAWLREGARIFAVRPGDNVPRLGRVIAVAVRNGRWTLIGESGADLLPGRENGENAPTPARAPFARRMIFGDDK